MSDGDDLRFIIVTLFFLQ